MEMFSCLKIILCNIFVLADVIEMADDISKNISAFER